MILIVELQLGSFINIFSHIGVSTLNKFIVAFIWNNIDLIGNVTFTTSGLRVTVLTTKNQISSNINENLVEIQITGKTHFHLRQSSALNLYLMWEIVYFVSKVFK